MQVRKRTIGIGCWEGMEGECPGRGTGDVAHFRREVETYLNGNSMEFARVALAKILIVGDMEPEWLLFLTRQGFHLRYLDTNTATKPEHVFG